MVTEILIFVFISRADTFWKITYDINKRGSGKSCFDLFQNNHDRLKVAEILFIYIIIVTWITWPKENLRVVGK